MNLSILILFFSLSLQLSRVSAFNSVRAKVDPMASLSRDLSTLHMIENNDEKIINDDDDVPIIAQSTVKIDDHGSDLTDRFKYKVNALMGKFDPAQPDLDNENTDGNILQAIMKFPSPYVFNVVGRTNGDDEATEGYIEDIKRIIFEISGDKDLGIEYTPRGRNFTKVKIEAIVESASMITMIYDQLADHELTKMRF